MSKKFFQKILITFSFLPLLITNTKAEAFSRKDAENNEYYKYKASVNFSIDPDSNFSKRYLPQSIKLKQISVAIKQGDKLLGTGFLLKKEEDIYTILTSREILENSTKDKLIEIVFFDGNTYTTSEIEYIKNLDLATLKIRSDKNYEIGKFKKLPINVNSTNNALFKKALFNIGVKNLSQENKPLYLLNSGNLIANTDFNIPKGYQLIYSNRSPANFLGGPIFDRNGYIVGIHSAFDENKRLKPKGEDFVGVSQGIPIDLIFDSINKTSDTKNENKKYITNGYDDELRYYVRKMDKNCRVGPSGGIVGTNCSRTLSAIADNNKCFSESIQEIINTEREGSFKIEYTIKNKCYGNIIFSDKEIAESVFFDHVYKKSLHNIMNNLYGRTITTKLEPNKVIEKSAACEKKIVEYYGNPNFMRDSVQAEKDYENCKVNRDKSYQAALKANTKKKYIPGINDNNILPEKIVKSCIILDNYRFEERYDVPGFYNCLTYASRRDRVGWLVDPVRGKMKGSIKEFWVNDTSKYNLCKTFPYDDEKRACAFFLNKNGL